MHARMHVRAHTHINTGNRGMQGSELRVMFGV